MEIGLRIVALIIDLAFCLGSLQAIVFASNVLFNKAGFSGLLFTPLWFAIILLWPILYFAIPTGIWGKSLGKLICRLSVKDCYGRPVGFWRALGREALKFLVLVSSIGAWITLFQLIFQGTTWYDHLCSTQVEFSPYVRLTETQKNWRKFHNIKNPR